MIWPMRHGPYLCKLWPRHHSHITPNAGSNVSIISVSTEDLASHSYWSQLGHFGAVILDTPIFCEFKFKGAYLDIVRLPSRKLKKGKKTKTTPSEYYEEKEKYNSIAQYVTFHCPDVKDGKGFLSFNRQTFRSPPIQSTTQKEKKVGFKITLMTSRFFLSKIHIKKFISQCHFFLNLNPSKVLNCICKKGEIKTSPTTKTCHWYQGGQAGGNELSS